MAGGSGWAHSGKARGMGRRRGAGGWATALVLAAGLVLGGCGPLGTAGGRVPHGMTHCGWDGAGVCPALGHGARRQPLPQRIGIDQEVNLAPYFTNDAVTTAEAGLRYGGLAGAAFPVALFPSSGTLTIVVAGDQHVSFLIPAFGPDRRSVLSLARPVTIPVPPGVYADLWLLEAGAGGNIGPLAMALTYADHRQAQVPVTFGDWCNGGLPMLDAPPEYVGITLPAVLTTAAALRASATAASGTAPSTPAGTRHLHLVTMRCGLWAEEVALPSAAAPLVALRLPARARDADPNAFVMALTLQRVVPGSGTAATS